MNLRATHSSCMNESIAVNHDVAFDALYLLIGVETIVSLAITPFDTLGVQCPIDGLSD